MKKILILTAILFFANVQNANASCPIDIGINPSKSCSVSLQGQNQTINDKLIPNNLNQMTNPTRNSSREFKKQPHTRPEPTNREQYNDPEQREGNTPYNAACQFGVCLPGETGNSQTGR